MNASIALDAAFEQAEAARIETLSTALRASLTVMREWINRAERNGGVVNIEDVPGAKKLYNTLLKAYRG